VGKGLPKDETVEAVRMVGGELDSGGAGEADAEEVEAEAVGDGGNVEGTSVGEKSPGPRSERPWPRWSR
jgi:hypothetical protein